MYKRQLHTLNFSAGYSLNKHFNLKLQVNDLLNRDVIFKQDVPTTGQEMDCLLYTSPVPCTNVFSFIKRSNI